MIKTNTCFQLVLLCAENLSFSKAAQAKKEREAQKKVIKKERKTLRNAVKVFLEKVCLMNLFFFLNQGPLIQAIAE